MLGSTPQSNILKVRDDITPIYFSSNAEGAFNVIDKDISHKWMSEQTSFSIQDIRSRVEPWLTALFQSENFSLLVGSGLTNAIHIIATGENASGMGLIRIPSFSKEIQKYAKISAESNGRGTPNIEDQLRIGNELLAGLKILDDERSTKLEQEIKLLLMNFTESLLKNENNIALAEAKRKDEAFSYLVHFLMSFASRNGTRERLNIFTTNYDRIIEVGAELAGLNLLDRFVGTITPIFRSSRLDIDMHYNPPGIRGEPRYLEGVSRFTKLHGSLDWIQNKDNIQRVGLPIGATNIIPYITNPYINSDPSRIMVFPNSAKDRETIGYPYVELFRDFASAICVPNSTVVTYGYSFGDQHINRILFDMLTIPSTHLVIISYDDLSGRIMDIYKELGRFSQISLLIGPDLADLIKLTTHYLPKSSIDKTTFKMSNLLRNRYGTEILERENENKETGELVL